MLAELIKLILDSIIKTVTVYLHNDMLWKKSRYELFTRNIDLFLMGLRKYLTDAQLNCSNHGYSQAISDQCM